MDNELHAIENTGETRIKMQKLSFTILGEPASKANQRRLVTHNGRPSFIKSEKALAYAEDAVWQLHCQKINPIAGDVSVTMRIFYASRRPDLDESVILDVLQGYAYLNDRQVKEKHIYHGLDKERPRAEIIVEMVSK